MDLFKSVKQIFNNVSNQPIQINIIPEAQPQTENQITGKGVVIDPYFEQNYTNASAIKTRFSRISNHMLREIAQRDWLIASILRVRSDTIASFANYSNDPLKPSYHFVRRDGKDITEQDEKSFQIMASLLENMGFSENIPDSDRQNLKEFMRVATRDALIYGYVPIEKIFKRDGSIHHFRARPADSFYLADSRFSKQQMKSVIDHSQKHVQDIYRYKHVGIDVNQVDNEEILYCQLSMDNQVIAAFGTTDLIWRNFGFQSGSDSVGYPISHLEQSLKLVLSHMNVDNYNEKIFTNGYAAKGILHLKGNITQDQLVALRRQFQDSISGTENSWRTLIVGGMDEVSFVSMAPNSKDMEYMSYSKMIALNLCSTFAINPEELGLEAISGQQRSASNSENAEFKIEHSKERGLEPLLRFFEDLFNYDIFPAINKEFSETYRMEYFFSEDSPASFAALLQAEMTTNSSYNDILRKSGKKSISHPIADLPLSQNFWQIVEKNMTRGEIREHFLNDKDASQNPMLQYIPGDPMFIQWQDHLMKIQQASDQKKQQDDAQAQHSQTNIEQLISQEQQMQAQAQA